MDEALELLEMLNSMDEDVRIDAKTGSKADRSILESICAFSNEPNLGGGKIILGVSADETDNVDGVKSYKVVGVTNPDKIQSDIANQCADSFNISIRPSITVEKIEGKNVVIINVSELDERSKPLFFKNEGLPRGAYRRIGPTDQRCTEDDMPLFYSTTDSYDSALVDDTSMDDIDENAVERYRSLREAVNPHAEELSYNDQDLLIALGACKRMSDKSIRLTHTGLLVFGKSMSQRRLIPAVRVDYIRVPGTEWLQNPDTRFDTIDMRGPLILVVNRAYNAIVDDISKGFILSDGDIQAKSNIALPSKTLREAIVNSLIHRTYRINRPIQIIRYNNRIEITNPGFSLKSEESLGEPGSVLRNPFISAIFHETNLAETKGSGIGVMRKLMCDAGMMPPTFDSDHARNQFTIRLLLHHLLDENDIKWLENFAKYELSDSQKVAAVFVREVGAIDNITYRQLSGLKTAKASRDLAKMSSCELLCIKKHGNQTYYTAGNILSLSTKVESLSTMAEGLSTMAEPLSTMAEPLSTMADDVPIELKKKIESLGKRTHNKEIINEIVVELCKIRPRSISELADILGRSDNYIKHDVVPPLRMAGKLDYTIPDMIKHPEQKYKAK